MASVVVVRKEARWVWGRVRGRNGSEKARRDVNAHLRLILPFSDSWLSGSLGAASSEGGVDAESCSRFARAAGIVAYRRSRGRIPAWRGRGVELASGLSFIECSSVNACCIRLLCPLNPNYNQLESTRNKEILNSSCQTRSVSRVVAGARVRARKLPESQSLTQLKRYCAPPIGNSYRRSR